MSKYAWHLPLYRQAQVIAADRIVIDRSSWRDDAIQRAYFEATYWRDPANNPASTVYGGPMVHVTECAAWTWDARPYPFFPELTDAWSDISCS